MQQSLDLDLTRIDASERWRTDRARDFVRTATAPEAQTCSRRRSIPGVGQRLARVRLDEMPAIQRVPRVPAGVSDGRLVQGAQASAGTRDGTSGQKIGHAARTWACSEAAGLGLRNHPAGQPSRARLVNKPGQGNAVTLLAHPLARAVSDLWQRDTAGEMAQGCNESRSRARAPAASRAADPSASSLTPPNLSAPSPASLLPVR